MKKALTVYIALLLAFGAQAAIIVDTTFTNVIAQQLALNNTNASGQARMPTAVGALLRYSANTVTNNLDKGWQAQSVWANFSNNVSLLEIGSSEFRDTNTTQYGFGQLNTDSKATTGNVQFKFTIASFSGWDSDDRAYFFVDVFGANGTIATINSITLQPTWGATNATGYSFIGTAQTAQIGASTANNQIFTTGNIDMGTGYDYVGFRILEVDASGTIGSADNLYISTIEVIPAPAEDLSVTPDTAAAFSGIKNGSYTPASVIYTLTNTGSSSLSWSVAHGASWLDVSPVSGTLASAASITVTASVNSAAADALTISGLYTDTLVISNSTSGAAQTRSVTLNFLAGAPAAPSGLTAAATGVSSIKVTWTDNSNDEQNFVIERKTGAGSFAQIATPAANVKSYNDTGLLLGTTYTYRVSATNAAGASGWSSEASAVPQVVSLVRDPAFADIGISNNIPIGEANNKMDQSVCLNGGWYASSIWANLTTNGLEVGASNFRPPATNQAMFGQMSTDNKFTQGSIRFQFDISSFESTWDADDRILFQVDVFGTDTNLPAANDQIILNPLYTGLDLPNGGTNNGSGNWIYIGSAQTPQIGENKTTGSFLTGDIDMGAGYNYVGFRIAPISASGTLLTGDTLYIAQITTVSGSAITNYTLTVNNGTGSGSYTNGQVASIVANAPASGYAFDRWTGDTQFVASVSSSNTTVTMPTQAVSVTATYIATEQYTTSAIPVPYSWLASYGITNIKTGRFCLIRTVTA